MCKKQPIKIINHTLHRSRSSTIVTLTDDEGYEACPSRIPCASTEFGTIKVIISSKRKCNLRRKRSLLVKLYPSRAIESTNALHVNHMVNLVRQKQKLNPIWNLIDVADGGRNWSFKGIENFISMGLMWADLELDTLVVQCYAPGHSRFNPIERLWSFLTKKIATLTVPDTLMVLLPN